MLLCSELGSTFLMKIVEKFEEGDQEVVPSAKSNLIFN